VVDVVKTPADIWAEVTAKAAHDHQARLDLFAGIALNGMLATGDVATTENPAKAAAWAYDFAEAMVAERAKRGRT
jgi:hypothetical protein